MLKLCPTCLHHNPKGSTLCRECGNSFAQVPVCAECGATRLAFAQFCYHCGSLLPADLPTENTTGREASRALAAEEDWVIAAEEWQATTFHSQGVQLFHQPTTTFWDLPMLTTAIIIGKRSDTFKPDLDFRDLPQSEFLSRSHAQISVHNRQFYLEDLGSKNGTAINGVPLPKGQAQLLAFGDHLCLGGTEAFTFIFIKDQPVNTDHLSMISGQDRAFEAELLSSYCQSVNALLDALQLAIALPDFTEVKRLANQIAIASYNVGANVMNLLAKQLEDQALQQVLSACEKTQRVLHDGLSQIEQFASVFYAI